MDAMMNTRENEAAMFTGRSRTESGRWAAVLGRDPRADGAFVYAVRTTRIYCQPSCPSRPARRENVTFFDTTAAAEAAGYRACKRCRPGAATKRERDAAIVAKACAIIAEAEEAPSLDALGAAVGVSPFHFHRMFKAVMGITPKAYAASERARRMREGLDTGASVTAAIYGAGYGSSSRFYERGQDRLGMAASAYKKGGRTSRFVLRWANARWARSSLRPPRAAFARSNSRRIRTAWCARCRIVFPRPS